MRISDTEIKKIVEGTGTETFETTDALLALGHEKDDDALVARTTERVMAMPDREPMIADLRARIEAGTYAPTSEQIVDGMVRRRIADHLG